MSKFVPLYKIGWYSYEESCYISFTHDEKYSHDELTKIIGEAAVKAIKEEKGEKHHYLHGFDDIFYAVADILGRDYGFAPLAYDEEWDIFGWASIFDKTDWGSNRDEVLDEITNTVLAAGFTRNDDDHIRRTEHPEENV